MSGTDLAITVFPDEVFRAQEAWARRAFRNLIYFQEADRGGHFAMWENPELFAAELRAAFRRRAGCGAGLPVPSGRRTGDPACAKRSVCKQNDRSRSSLPQGC